MALVEVPDRRGRCPSARSARTPPTPRTSSWWRRISRPRTYRMWVIGRSASSFSGRSVSSRRTGTRPTWASQTATASVAARQLDRHLERIAVRRRPPAGAAGGSGRSRGRRAPGGRRRRSSGGSSPCGRAARRRRTAGPCRWPTSCGRRRGRRARPSRSRATRGSRTRRRSRRSGRRARSRAGGGTSGPSRWPGTCRSRRRIDWYSAMQSGLSSSSAQRIGPSSSGTGLR